MKTTRLRKTIPYVFIPIVLSCFIFFFIAWQAEKSRNEHMVLAVVWYQTSAEVRALLYQSYNTARMMVDRNLAEKSAKPRALIVDVDETILDNSPYNAKQILSNEMYPTGWREWVELAKAEAIPGAVEFLNYAESKGVHVFYVSNRKLEEQPATMKNLRAKGFPKVIEERFLFQDKESSKESRRQKIAEKYNIILLMGDNLNDFSDAFEQKSVTDRFVATDRFKEEWGKKFIVLPNPFYGDWEGAIYDYNFRRSDEERDKLRKSVLRTY